MKRTPGLRLAALLALATPAFPASAPARSATELFETRVRPVLAASCYACHARSRQGGLRVDSRQALIEGGDSGPAIVPGDPDGSLLIRAVRHEIAGREMPRGADPLGPRDVEGLVEWIRMGAPWPDAAPGAIAVASVAGEELSPGAQLFADRVRPVLEGSCFACHAGDARSGLRLDSREGMLRGGVRGPAIVPGAPERSLLMAAVRHERDDVRMPKDSDPLSESEIEAFAEWIGAGAEWPDLRAPVQIARREVTAAERGFWSFRPLAAPAVPRPARTDWARTDIDRFVLTRMEEKGLAPLGMANPRQLIRRATFDLTGLPPTPAEIDVFLNDTAPDAFERVVDRLLASPHYGERWGRLWLDVARFGEDDTRGLAEDGTGRERYRSAYVQRDWVVEAFNRDMPYDLFVKAQLAGDLLEEPERTRALGGLGFLGGGPWYYDLANPAVARADERHDRVDVTTRGFLGLTVGCARCHDHKYDPVGSHDYYALAGVFNNTTYHEYLLADEKKAEAHTEDKQFIESMQESLNEYLRTESEQLARVLTMQASTYMMAAWQVTGKPKLPPERAASGAKVDLETLQRWIRFLGKEPRHYPYLEDWQAMIARGDAEEDEARGLADAFQRLLLEVVAEQSELEERNRRIIAKGTPLEEVKSTPMPNGFESFFDRHQLELETLERDRFNLYTDVYRRDLDNTLDTFFPAPGLLRFRGWSLERQLGRVAADHVAAMRARIEELEEALPDVPFVMGVRDKDPEDLTDIRLHLRGSPTNLGEPVPRGFMAVLAGEDGGPFAAGSGRLELAEAIASHPLAARVIVNRIWRWHLGSGIVDTPSNFGFAGERPTNPELLEYLAARFVDGGGSIKRLHRDIMLSATYQLRAGRHAGNERIDGGNRYYWRADRRRLDAESIRDALLHVSGGLDAKVGGPSLDLRNEEHDRRTLYGAVSRFQLDEYLQTFDFPNPSLSAERRYATNVPQQSLFFMNSPFVHRQAERLVKHLAKETGGEETAGGDEATGGEETAAEGDEATGGEETAAEGEEEIPAHLPDREMIRAAYPLLYGREVSEAELAAGLAFLAERRASAPAADADAEAAEEGPRQEGSAPDNGSDDLAARRAAMQAWTQYARALFSAAEFRFIE